MRISWSRACTSFVRYLTVFGLAAVATTASSADRAADLVNKSRSDAALQETLVAEGRKAAFFCANCHGDAGISRFTNVPNLAGQHPDYVLTQIEAFLSGARKDEFMQGLMRVLNEREKAAIALMYSSMPVIPATEPGPRAASGGQHFQQLCARCHQTDAHGGKDFPRLAGQQPDYLRLSLKRYLTMSGERFYPPMTAAVAQLGAQNIDAMVEFLSSQP
ncbi:c-type cytochrome [Pseudothauera nasutitermitis]|uniref:C-type cytochrome n=1 Tax=Pseudothauera nasutitermitis TaxID=2565930 RepID=A0A4V6RX58_9RHOO|nr:c-type cytochrome [Pseudothauera nasutitermitis]THF62819.1 c-type cytochrome [Pseudothauera nasutitermitis]